MTAGARTPPYRSPIATHPRFHPTNVGYVYGRYKRAGSDEMDESFFPVLWREDGYRTPFLDGGARGAPPMAGDGGPCYSTMSCS